MNFYFSEYNRPFYFSHQKSFSSLFNSRTDLDFDFEKHDTTTSKNILFNNNDKEDDKFKPVKDYNPIKYGDIQKFKSFLVTPCDNYTSYFKNNLSDFPNDENSYNQREKERIFKIEKINKKIGRIKKNSILKGIHNKLANDNIIRKIKGRFIEKVRLY